MSESHTQHKRRKRRVKKRVAASTPAADATAGLLGREAVRARRQARARAAELAVLDRQKFKPEAHASTRPLIAMLVLVALVRAALARQVLRSQTPIGR